ncbi:maleylacetoacetate isomerase [Conidiobolus coronatus NRRL 28638]|uniref:Maleylacetoacetate isomerase n=1 Tax=Conidiobolus coronatus (strain ATCC 28846 / CBS 209.66 / NRRL 28638) TaxID=796925 RepID=A0A137P3R8_CONC2|nr:maleylacetoacetate isomerase [Conidiobolus coronatus NRRL 28638]|eukprot:KXN69653.1 maleylacetoacetate isomerase [Conidiobolus coronatus NRRL 28638]
MSESSKPVLYSYYRSSCSARVRAVLHWKGIDFETKPVHLVKSEQTNEEYAKLNPHKEVPTLLIDGLVLTQSVAIIEYLEEAYPEKPLLPKDLGKRALVRSIVNSIASDIQPVQNLRVLNKIGDEKVQWANHFITIGFEALEAILAKSSGKYSVGDEVTLADALVPAQVHNATRFNVDLTKFPTIVKVNDNLMKLEAFQKADWKNQPDTPEEFRV